MSKKTFIISGIIFIIFGGIFMITSSQNNDSTGTSQENSTISKTETKSAIFETIATVQYLKKRLEAKNPNDILLDVRTPEEFSEGHIQGAINLDMQNPNFSSEIQNLDKTKTYIVFCRSGNRALTASQEMSKIGLNTVYSKGGITLWQSSGFAVVK